VGFKCYFNRELFKTSDIMCRFVISSFLSWYNYYVLIVPLVSEEFSFETLLCLHFSVVQFIHCVTENRFRITCQRRDVNISAISL